MKFLKHIIALKCMVSYDIYFAILSKSIFLCHNIISIIRKIKDILSKG